ncbi:TetR/AcrR family transcriptional regulator [Cellulomonas denverensis]|uniref:TetR/AcrR family transcriptional regulator n=1 Tax=Cellulomonas denverensis TaxID=264297 RepID=A0A7X6QYB0_9CELL|nr:TetR/AcrR family transcriptional regulator [Cellulomonas denverensis]NKY21955.1 TetR/AcrR family transcriptional regulator [Cellulomonas denverensis]GIG24152.1 TetR family transcriptional regulator [Cellulomonas denverensis]
MVDPRVARSRARVLAATLELIAERGVAGVTIEAVALRCGVARTTVYRHWPDPPALVRDAFAATLAPPPVPDTGSLRGDLLALVDGLGRALAEGTAARLMTALIDAAQRDEGFAALHRAEAEARHRSVLEVLERGVRRGELDPGADLPALVDLLAGPVFYRWSTTGRAPDDAFVRLVVDSALREAGAGGSD